MNTKKRCSKRTGLGQAICLAKAVESYLLRQRQQNHERTRSSCLTPPRGLTRAKRKANRPPDGSNFVARRPKRLSKMLMNKRWGAEIADDTGRISCRPAIKNILVQF